MIYLLTYYLGHLINKYLKSIKFDLCLSYIQVRGKVSIAEPYSTRATFLNYIKVIIKWQIFINNINKNFIMFQLLASFSANNFLYNRENNK